MVRDSRAITAYPVKQQRFAAILPAIYMETVVAVLATFPLLGRSATHGPQRERLTEPLHEVHWGSLGCPACEWNLY